MKQKELELLVSLGHIENIEVRRPQGAASGWLVIAWPGENALRRFAPELETAKGEPRVSMATRTDPLVANTIDPLQGQGMSVS